MMPPEFRRCLDRGDVADIGQGDELRAGDRRRDGPAVAGVDLLQRDHSKGAPATKVAFGGRLPVARRPAAPAKAALGASLGEPDDRSRCASFGRQMRRGQAGHHGRPGGPAPAMKTLVIQSYQTDDVPAWIRRCLASAKAWAQQSGYDHLMTDDRAFQLCGPDYLAATGGNKIMLSDLARLEMIRIAHRDGYERAIWMDADVFVFDPAQLRIPPVNRITFARETWDQAGRAELGLSAKLQQLRHRLSARRSGSGLDHPSHPPHRPPPSLARQSPAWRRTAPRPRPLLAFSPSGERWDALKPCAARDGAPG